MQPRVSAVPARRVLVGLLAFDALVLGIAIGIGVAIGRPERLFAENQPVTWLSYFHLIACAFLAWELFKAAAAEEKTRHARSPAILWALVTLGFVFLALDDIAGVHESLDHAIHRALGITETALTDRLDDAIIALYGVIGVAVLFHYRDALLPHRRSAGFFLAGFSIFAAMVAVDGITNRPDLITDKHLFVWLAVAEDAGKILAEALFLAGLYSCYRRIEDERNGREAERAGASPAPLQ